MIVVNAVKQKDVPRQARLRRVISKFYDDILPKLQTRMEAASENRKTRNDPENAPANKDSDSPTPDELRLLDLEKHKRNGEKAGLSTAERLLVLSRNETAQLFDVIAPLFIPGNDSLADVCENLKELIAANVSYE